MGVAGPAPPRHTRIDEARVREGWTGAMEGWTVGEDQESL